MKFPKLHLVCSNDELRPVMNCICVNKEFTYATNGNILVRHKTSEIFKEDFFLSLPDEPILIPSSAIATLCKKSTFAISLTEDKKQIQLKQVDRSVVIYNLVPEKYLNCEGIIPNEKDCKPLNKIGINTSLLSCLTLGMDCNVPILKLYFYGPTKAILVKSEYSEYFSTIGVIMPCMTNE